MLVVSLINHKLICSKSSTLALNVKRINQYTAVSMDVGVTRHNNKQFTDLVGSKAEVSVRRCVILSNDTIVF